MKDLNSNLAALQQLKQQNQQLLQDNNELRDLCCYLDDERARARTIAQEWSSFGSHMSKVMRKEIGSYSQKLAALETKQFELVRENYELKQLCLLLDNAVSVRENGDGSSGGGNSFADISGGQQSNSNLANVSGLSVLSNYGKGVHLNRLSRLPTDLANDLTKASPEKSEMNKTDSQKSGLNRQILEYIKSLEERITELELDRKQRTLERSSTSNVSDQTPTKSCENNLDATAADQECQQTTNDVDDRNVQQRCPTVIGEAMNVLRIQQSIEDLTVDAFANDRNNNELASDSANPESRLDADSRPLVEQQKQIVRQLCDAALRKIEDG